MIVMIKKVEEYSWWKVPPQNIILFSRNSIIRTVLLELDGRAAPRIGSPVERLGSCYLSPEKNSGVKDKFGKIVHIKHSGFWSSFQITLNLKTVQKRNCDQVRIKLWSAPRQIFKNARNIFKIFKPFYLTRPRSLFKGVFI